MSCFGAPSTDDKKIRLTAQEMSMSKLCYAVPVDIRARGRDKEGGQKCVCVCGGGGSPRQRNERTEGG